MKVSREELAAFLNEVIDAKMQDPAGMPTVETTREICEHYNRKNLAEFNKVGYFIIQGVRVCEKGKSAECDKRDAMTRDELQHGIAK